MRLSLCMIALDAEATIGRCLDSIRDHVDEIVVADTGSSDRTVEECERRGARVVRFTPETHPESFALDEDGLGPAPHTGRRFLADFAAARNFAFAQATGDYIMWLDADDAVEDAATMRDVRAALEFGAPSAWLRYCDSAKCWWRERIVQRGGMARWVSPVHEVLTPVHADRRFESPRVIHLGPGGAGRVAHRNYKILLRALAADGDELDPRLCYYLGREASAAGDADRAVWAFERCIRHVGFAEQRLHARLGLAAALSNNGDVEGAFRQHAASAVEFCDMPHGWLGLAGIAYTKGDWPSCAAWCERGLGLLGNEGMLWAPERGELVVAHQMLNRSLDLLGRTAEALDVAEKGLLLEPGNPYLVQNRDAYRRALGIRPDTADTGERIMLLLPSRGRPKAALEAVRTAMETAANFGSVDALVGVEPDDAEAYRREFGKDAAAIHVLARGGNYVAAIRELVNAPTAVGCPIVGLIADDFRFETPAWDSAIRREFAGMPGRLGLVFGDDGLQHGNLATAPFLSQEWIAAVGDVLPGKYTHLWCDTEIDDIARRAGVARYLPGVRIRHAHWLVGAPKDAGYERVERTNQAGFAEFSGREQERLRIAGSIRAAERVAVRLSILIPSLARRSDLLRRICESLNAQRLALPVPTHVEILVDIDNGEISIGAKRNRLLDKAMGLYVAFVDDDDEVAPDYLAALLAEIRASAPDCVTFDGVMTSDGQTPVRFELKLAHREWSTAPDGTFLRPPNHACAVRSAIARRACAVRSAIARRACAARAGPADRTCFPDASYPEDRAWSEAILPMLGTERHVARELYRYRRDWTRYTPWTSVVSDFEPVG